MTQRQDIVFGLGAMALGLAAAWMAGSYSGAGGAYPMVLGVILTLLGAIVALRAQRAGAGHARALVGAPAKFLTATAAAAIYVAAIVPLGFYTASFLLMLALPAALGFRRWRHALTVGALFVAIVFAVFSLFLEKPLPRELIMGASGG